MLATNKVRVVCAQIDKLCIVMHGMTSKSLKRLGKFFNEFLRLRTSACSFTSICCRDVNPCLQLSQFQPGPITSCHVFNFQLTEKEAQSRAKIFEILDKIVTGKRTIFNLCQSSSYYFSVCLSLQETFQSRISVKNLHFLQ